VQEAQVSRCSAGIHVGCVRASLLMFAVALLSPAQAPSGSASMPVIDMHFHTMWMGPTAAHKRTGTPAIDTPEEMRRLNLAAMDRNHVVKAVASGDQLHLYGGDVGKRLLPGLILPAAPKTQIGPLEPSPEVLRQMHKEGKLAVLAEFGPQYLGLEPASPKLEPYWALAEELDIAVGIHMGPGPRGVAYGSVFPEYRMRLSNPLLLEDVLVRHPKLRVYISHAGWPFIDELLGLLWAHPQVNVDLGVINWVLPEVEFHSYLRRIIDAGFSDRVMFGSDNMGTPGSIDMAVRRTSAPFLSEDQKRDILCRNAAKFLRLGNEVCRQ